MAKAQDLSEATIRRIRKQHDLKAHLVKAFKLSRDKRLSKNCKTSTVLSAWKGRWRLKSSHCCQESSPAGREARWLTSPQVQSIQEPF